MIMEVVTIHTAKTTLSQLLLRVEAGEEIVLARGKEPIAKLVPFKPIKKTRRLEHSKVSSVLVRSSLSLCRNWN
jgi:prevent-host-death family protein